MNAQKPKFGIFRLPLPRTSRELAVFLLLTVLLPSEVLASEVAATDTLAFADGLYSRQMYGPAAAEYQKFIEANPESDILSDAKFRMAESHYFLKRYEKASALFEAFIAEYSADKRISIAYFRLGLCQYFQKNYKKASEILFDAARMSSDPELKSGSLFHLGKSYEAMGDADRSKKIFERILVSYPKTDYAIYSSLMLGERAAQEKNHEAAIQYFTMASRKPEEKSVFASAQSDLARIYFETKEFSKARQFYEAVFAAGVPEYIDASIVGVFYSDYELKDYEHAQKFYAQNRDSVDQSRVWAEALYALALLGTEKDDDKTANALFDRLTAADTSLRARALLGKAKIRVKEETWDEAIGLLQDALKAKPREEKAEISYLLGLAYRAKGKFADSAQTWWGLVREFTHSSFSEKALIELIQYSLDDKKYSAAKKASQLFIDTYPDSPLMDIAVYKRALALAAIGEYAESAELFSTVTAFPEISSLKSEAQYGAAVSYDKAGRPMDAIKFYGVFVADNPQHELARESRLRLAYLLTTLKDNVKAADVYYNSFIHFPSDEVPSEVALWLVRHFIDQSDYVKARDVLELIVTRYPSENLTHEASFFLGECAVGDKDYERAVEHYSKALSAEGGRFVPYIQLGLGIAHAGLGNVPEAERHLNEALTYDEELVVALRTRFELANLRLMEKNVGEAARLFMLVAVLYDDDRYCPLALYKAGECFSAMGKQENAAKAWNELKNRYPGSEWAKKVPT